ncbi:putative MFS family arabinose efflux permease [Geodermatophilus normandii]|uniref:Putative MFS family arabinose efflux permease n=1 Tax=Geodermatophilus normandii TaxID=1137989 RepID=A0A317QDY1_9ACTN|nr:MFS transporter [Geodermatophilus normandii]PWW21928.1 putative MFS family arabinose efflux permease [Geodermatophilus normandii]
MPLPPAARPLARLAVVWTALSGLAPVYPLYALLFLDTGLSAAQVSGLFALWSVTGLLAEVPTGVLADRWSRRGSLVLAGVLEAAGFVLWTVAPGLPGFAAGFVVWGVGGALVSGAAEAVVYEGLAAAGAEDSFVRVQGATTATELLVQVPTALLAGVLVEAGGHALVGWASVGTCLAAAALATRFPETAPTDGGDDGGGGLRSAVTDALRRPSLRLTVVAVALLGGLDALEEYFPVMARDRGVPTALVPTAVLVVALAGAAGAALAGRLARLPSRALPALLTASAGLLAVGALAGAAVAPAAVALSYGLYLAVLVVGEARLQEQVPGAARATVTSVAGLGTELASLLVFAAWALGSAPAVAVLFLAVAPVVALGLRARQTR